MKYSLGFRASVVRKTQDGTGRTINQVARETGISVATVSNWLDQFKNGTLSLDGCDALTPSQRSPGEKLSLLLESRSVTDEAHAPGLLVSCTGTTLNIAIQALATLHHNHVMKDLTSPCLLPATRHSNPAGYYTPSDGEGNTQFMVQTAAFI